MNRVTPQFSSQMRPACNQRRLDHMASSRFRKALLYFMNVSTAPSYDFIEHKLGSSGELSVGVNNYCFCFFCLRRPGGTCSRDQMQVNNLVCAAAQRSARSPVLPSYHGANRMRSVCALAELAGQAVEDGAEWRLNAVKRKTGSHQPLSAGPASQGRLARFRPQCVYCQDRRPKGAHSLCRMGLVSTVRSLGPGRDA